MLIQLFILANKKKKFLQNDSGYKNVQGASCPWTRPWTLSMDASMDKFYNEK